MENLIWLVLIGSVFFIMMRKGGCCGGHAHGKSKGEVESARPGEAAAASNGKGPGCH